jgi:hypothetical protein
MPGLAPRGAARSVRDRLASSGTILGELLFVQRSALNTLRFDAGRAVNGYADSKEPKSGYRKSRGASRGLEFGNEGRALHRSFGSALDCEDVFTNLSPAPAKTMSPLVSTRIYVKKL